MKRLIFLFLALGLAGCGPMNVADLKSSGNQTARYESAKSPMDFASCVILAYDSATPAYHPAQMRPTPTGLEILKTISVNFRLVVAGVIEVDAIGEGSSVMGTASGHNRFAMDRLAALDSIIRQCL